MNRSLGRSRSSRSSSSRSQGRARGAQDYSPPFEVQLATTFSVLLLDSPSRISPRRSSRTSLRRAFRLAALHGHARGVALALAAEAPEALQRLHILAIEPNDHTLPLLRRNLRRHCGPPCTPQLNTLPSPILDSALTTAALCFTMVYFRVGRPSLARARLASLPPARIECSLSSSVTVTPAS